MILRQNRNFGDRFQVKTFFFFFFFFREHPDFGTKIGIFSRLRPANSNNFEKWPTRVQKLHHPVIGLLTQMTTASSPLNMLTRYVIVLFIDMTHIYSTTLTNTRFKSRPTCITLAPPEKSRTIYVGIATRDVPIPHFKPITILLPIPVFRPDITDTFSSIKHQ